MATRHTYYDALYDYTVFIVFIAGPVLICSGILKVISMKFGWKWGWQQRAALGTSLGFVSLCVWAGQYFFRVRLSLFLTLSRRIPAPNAMSGRMCLC